MLYLSNYQKIFAVLYIGCVMERTRHIGLLFIVSGLTSSFVALLGIRPELGPIDTGASELAAVFVLVISFGFVVTGWGWFRSLSGYPRVPAFVLGAVGVISIVGGAIVFRSWEYGGMAGGLREIFTFAIVVAGVGIVLISVFWFIRREYRPPLSLLAGLLAVGLFYVAHQRLDLLIAIPVLTVIVGVVFAGPIIAVLYGLKPRSVEQ